MSTLWLHVGYKNIEITYSMFPLATNREEGARGRCRLCPPCRSLYQRRESLFRGRDGMEVRILWADKGWEFSTCPVAKKKNEIMLLETLKTFLNTIVAPCKMVELFVSDISKGLECSGAKMTRGTTKELRIHSRRWPKGRCHHPTHKSWPWRNVTYVLFATLKKRRSKMFGLWS